MRADLAPHGIEMLPFPNELLQRVATELSIKRRCEATLPGLFVLPGGIKYVAQAR